MNNIIIGMLSQPTMTAGGFSDMWYDSLLMYMCDTGIMTKLEETSSENDCSVRSHYKLFSCIVTPVYIYRIAGNF